MKRNSNTAQPYCDCSIRVPRTDCSIRVYRYFKQVFKRPFMGPPGAPFRLGPGKKMPQMPPLWAALYVRSMIIVYILNLPFLLCKHCNLCTYIQYSMYTVLQDASQFKYGFSVSWYSITQFMYKINVYISLTLNRP